MQVDTVQSLIVAGEQVDADRSLVTMITLGVHVEVGGQKLGQLCDIDALAVLLQQPTVVMKFP